MNKIVTTYTKYDQNLHKDILGRQFDKEGNEFYYQPERLNEKTCSEGFFPPPWNINDHPEKTEGWIAFQEAMRNDPDYYKMR